MELIHGGNQFRNVQHRGIGFILNFHCIVLKTQFCKQKVELLPQLLLQDVDGWTFSMTPRLMIPVTGSRRLLRERCGKVTVSYRKASGVIETCKQYSGRELFGFLLVDSCQLPVFSGRNPAESIVENPKSFRPEYCFHKITGIIRNRPFPGRTVRPGL